MNLPYSLSLTSGSRSYHMNISVTGENLICLISEYFHCCSVSIVVICKSSEGLLEIAHCGHISWAVRHFRVYHLRNNCDNCITGHDALCCSAIWPVKYPCIHFQLFNHWLFIRVISERTGSRNQRNYHWQAAVYEFTYMVLACFSYYMRFCSTGKYAFLVMVVEFVSSWVCFVHALENIIGEIVDIYVL